MKVSEKLKNLRAKRVFNSHELVGHGGVYLYYINPPYRDPAPRRTQVVRVGYRNDPNGAWWDHGSKSFVGPRKESLPKAIEWAKKHYGIKEFKRDPFGNYVDAELLKRRLKELLG